MPVIFFARDRRERVSSRDSALNHYAMRCFVAHCFTARKAGCVIICSNHGTAAFLFPSS
jgi:hypothetical protein